MRCRRRNISSPSFGAVSGAAFAVALAVCLGVPACSSSDDPEAGVRPEVRAHAWIRLLVEIGGQPDGSADPGERASAATTSGSGVRISGQTRFLRYRDVSADTAEVLAGPVERTLGRGACELAAAGDALEATLASVPERALVTLLDGGELLVQVGETTGTMSPRHVPALFPYVTGVEYDELVITGDLAQLGAPGVPSASGESATAGGSPATGDATVGGLDVNVTGLGGGDVGGFDVVSTLPPAPRGVRAELNANALAVSWEPADPAPAVQAGTSGTPGWDDLDVEVVVQHGVAEPQLRCRAADDGVFAIPLSVLDELPASAWASAGELVVSVQRARRIRFRARGIHIGELEIAVRRVAPPLAR